MRPPECDICGKEENCNLVYFKKRQSDLEWDRRMEENGMVGHPPYAEWFCENHYPEAKMLSDLPIDEARKKLKK